jgi:hypothetical protein
MKNYEIEYLSYEGNIRVVECEGNNEDEAIANAIDNQCNYSGDDIHKVIEVREIE